jgi:general secretion pathway protein J
VAVTALQDWQVFYYRSNAWTNPLSSDATQADPTPAAPTPQNPASSPTPPTPPARTQPNARGPVLPDGIRIVLSLSGGQAVTGDLVIDWVRPTVSGGKSS